MKKVLLLSLLIGSVSVMAQNQRNTEPQLAPHKMKALQSVDASTSAPAKPFVMPAVKSPQQKPISSSANVYTLLVESQTCLTANQDLGLIMFTHRANPAAGLGLVSGNIVNSISSNQGQTWKQILTIGDNKGNRYPSGVIYNPSANTNPDNAFSVVCGPVTDGSGWMENFWGSAKLDSTNQNVAYENYTTFAQDFPRYGMSATGDGKIHVLGDKYIFTDGVGITTWDYLVMNNGTFNSGTNKFDWNRVKIYNTFAKLDAAGAYEVSNYSTAWSPDGTVGYVWVNGIDSTNPNTSYQPVVFKSIDQGATWTKLPFYNFANDTVIYNRIWATLADDQVKRPFFSSEMEAVVDNNGEIHFVGIITVAYSIHADSLGYTFKYEPKNVYHVYSTPTGWKSEQIGTILSLTVLAAESGYGSGADAVGWDHRIQVARTKDGTKIFAVWTDADTSFYETVIAPNIVAWGKNLTNNQMYPVTDFTTGTALDATCFFHYASDIVLEQNGNLVIPVTFAGLGATPADPVSHFYLTSVGYGSTIGINPVDVSKGLSLAGSFPNPTSDIANIQIHLGKAANTSIDVYSVTGQKVATVNYGMLSAGSQKLAVDVQNLTSGIYLYIIKAGNETASGKFVRN